MPDWVVVSSVASAAGTLALAGTTYFSIRSANRAARVAELSLLAALRPLLVSSSPEDVTQHVPFMDDVGVDAPGSGAGIVGLDGRVYIAISLRNVGPGIGVLYGGFVHGESLGASQITPRWARSGCCPAISTYRRERSASGRSRSATGTIAGRRFSRRSSRDGSPSISCTATTKADNA